jgi:hypothetical protein
MGAGPIENGRDGGDFREGGEFALKFGDEVALLNFISFRAKNQFLLIDRSGSRNFYCLNEFLKSNFLFFFLFSCK